MLPGADVDCPPFLFPFFFHANIPTFFSFVVGCFHLSPDRSLVYVCARVSRHISQELEWKEKKKNNLMRKLYKIFCDFSKCLRHVSRKNNPNTRGWCSVCLYSIPFFFISSSMCAYRLYSRRPASSHRRVNSFFFSFYSEPQLTSPRGCRTSQRNVLQVHTQPDNTCAVPLLLFISFFPPQCSPPVQCRKK